MIESDIAVNYEVGDIQVTMVLFKSKVLKKSILHKKRPANA